MRLFATALLSLLAFTASPVVLSEATAGSEVEGPRLNAATGASVRSTPLAELRSLDSALARGAVEGSDSRGEDRREMVDVIRREVRATSSYLGTGVLSNRVLGALSRVPRHRFVPESLAAAAYDNRPLPIGHGQTISQPYIVAIMTELLQLDEGDKVLEIGTGSGYQAAILAEVVEEVFTIEIVEPLAERSSALLKELDYDNVEARFGDGYYGWAEQAPFDGIIVTAAATHVPPPLLDQLAAGGRLIIPVGSRFMVQQLVLVEKSDTGEVTLHQILPVRFVPLTGDHD